MKRNKDEEIKDLKKKLRYKKILIVISYILLFLLIVLNFLVFYVTKDIFVSYEDDISYNFSSVSISEQNKVNKILRDINPIYLKSQKSITLTYNLSGNSSSITFGINKNNGEIYILANRDIMSIRRTLCHELLHTYFKYTEEAHDIIRDLAEKEVCYY
ncbi:MAG: hypothetical protein AABY22_12020 [Nanoarchaeota archaeon]